MLDKSGDFNAELLLEQSIADASYSDILMIFKRV